MDSSRLHSHSTSTSEKFGVVDSKSLFLKQNIKRCLDDFSRYLDFFVMFRKSFKIFNKDI